LLRSTPTGGRALAGYFFKARYATHPKNETVMMTKIQNAMASDDVIMSP
jgi:hypothetical protein